ncbi:MAG: CPBP family intramembrane metalloprotease, partial [Eubacteriales bacterium]|nr:CPBP family intramembrane metalloprotease [Eubacteriales bacterium]
MNPAIKPRVAIGIFVFLLVIVLTIIVAVPVQSAWKIWGLAITELMLLACALVPALLLKWDLKEVFPVKIPSLRQLFGVLVLLTGSYLSVLAINMVFFYLFPQGLTDVSNQFLYLFRSVPLPVALFIVAVMPAVCEECL